MTRALTIASVAACAAIASAGPALSQQDGIVRSVWLDRFAGYVEAGYELESQEREPPFGGSQFEQDENLLLYGLNADIKGGFLHPSLLTFDVGGTYRQRRSDLETSTGLFQGSRTADVSQFRARLNLFPGFQWSGEAAASQAVQDIDSTFAPQRTIERREIRLAAFNKSRTWPFRFTWRRADTEGLEGDPRDETRDNWIARLDRVGKSSQTRARVEYLEFAERSSSQDYDQLGASLGHRWRPGDRNTYLLSTTFNGFDRSGTSETKIAYASQGFIWTPRDTLELTAAFEARSQEDALGEIRSDRGKADVEHLLWGSLSSAAGLTLQRTEFLEGGEERLEEARTALRYERNLPSGAVTVDWGRRFRTDDRDTRGVAPIGSVSVTFDPVVPILLDTPGLVVGSVRVTNPSETVLYVEGIDYELIVLNGLVELRVLAGGTIFPGDDLLIRFSVEPGDPLELRTEVHQSGIGWRDATGFWVDYRRQRQAQEVTLGTADGRVDQVLEQRATMGFAGRRWRASASASDKKSMIVPLQRLSIATSWVASSGSRSSLTFRARAQRTRFPDRPGEEVRLLLGGADARFFLGRLQVSAGAQFWEEEILGRDGRFAEGFLNAAWRFNLFEVIGQLRLRRQDIEMAGRDDRDELRIVFRRYFR